MSKNICIIHYNTPILTECLVKSINKYTPDANIYVFDNSDKLPFRNSFHNVTVFDNTKGQIINFDQWLKKYPNKDKSGGKTNKWGSAKHAYSVEKCMSLLNEPFVLLDSDVLLKKDISPVFDDTVCYKGEVIYQGKSSVKRVLPFICYINTPMCFKNGVHYFDERYMHGLRVGPRGDYYDTGAALYLLTEQKRLPHREFKYEEYVVHFANGSWTPEAEKMRRQKHIPVKEWIDRYKNLWETENVSLNAESIFHKVFDHIYCLHYLPSSDRLPKLKDELKRVGIDENDSYFSWIYDYPSTLFNYIFENKDLEIDVALKSSIRKYVKRVSLNHYNIIKEAYALGYKRILILEDDVRFHMDLGYINKMLENIPDTDIVMFDKMTCSRPGENIKYKKYIKDLPEGTLYGSMNDSGVFFIFCSCYSLNRKAMQHIIETQEKKLLPPDTPLNDKEITGSFAIDNVAIQDPKFKIRTVESYDRISLDTTKYGQSDKITDTQNIVRQIRVPEQKPQQKAIKKQPVQQLKKPENSVKKQSVIHKQQIDATRIHKNNTFVSDKAKRVVKRTLSAKAFGSNKLYEM